MSFPSFPAFNPQYIKTYRQKHSAPQALSFRVSPKARPQPHGYSVLAAVSYGVMTCPLCQGLHDEVYSVTATDGVSAAQWMGCVECLGICAMNYLLETGENPAPMAVNVEALLRMVRHIITDPVSADEVEAAVEAIDGALRGK